MSGFSLDADCTARGCEDVISSEDYSHTYSTVWHGYIHSIDDLTWLRSRSDFRVFSSPIRNPDYAISWEIWLEYEYPRPYPKTRTGHWEPAWAT